MVPTDNELILHVIEGNDAAFEQLVYRYDKRVLTIALKYFPDVDDAKDVYQEVFIRIYKGLKNFKFQSEFSTWLFRIVTNVCFTHKARAKKKKHVRINDNHDEDDEYGVTVADYNENTSPEIHTSNTEIANEIDKALNSLSPNQKMSFILKHYEGYKIREIAVMMNCKEGTVKKYLFDGIRKLRSELKEFAI